MVTAMEHLTKVHEWNRPSIPKATRRNPTNTRETNSQQMRKCGVWPSEQDNKDSNQTKVNLRTDAKNFWELSTVQKLGDWPQTLAQLLKDAQIGMSELWNCIWSLRHAIGCEMQVKIQGGGHVSGDPDTWQNDAAAKCSSGDNPNDASGAMADFRAAAPDWAWDAARCSMTPDRSKIWGPSHPPRECLKSVMIDQIFNKWPPHTSGHMGTNSWH